MPSHDDRTPSGVDLSRPTESTRRHLYDLVVRIVEDADPSSAAGVTFLEV